MPVLNDKLMSEKLKRKWTTADFAQYFNVSPDEFLFLLEKNFTSRAYQNMVNEMKENEKLQKRYHGSKKRRNKFNFNSNEKKTLEMLNSEAENDLSDENISVPSIEDVTEDNSALNSKINLEILRLEESRIRDYICDTESSLKNLSNKKRGLYNLLKAKRNEFSRLEQLISRHEKDIEDILNQLNDLEEQKNSLNNDINYQRKELLAIQANIKALETVSIFVYHNEFECENTEIQIPDSWSQYYDEFVNLDEVEDLSIKQTKMLAKIISLIHLLQEQNMMFEITFDDKNVEEVYTELHHKFQKN